MRSGLSQLEFFNKMKKKPALQAILDNLDDYTEDELQNIKNQPLWIRTILVDFKTKDFEGEKQTSMNAEKIANEMMKSLSHTPYIKFEVREWIGNDWFMPCGMTGSMAVEIKYGDLLIIYNHAAHSVGISSSIGHLLDNDWDRVVNNTKPIDMMTKFEYSRFVSDKLGKRHTDREEIAKQAGPNSYVEPKTDGGFTIIRHGVTYR